MTSTAKPRLKSSGNSFVPPDSTRVYVSVRFIDPKAPFPTEHGDVIMKKVCDVGTGARTVASDLT